MDRNAIERHDFPVGRRGYDRAAVDTHLRRVADELEALKGRPLPDAPPLPLSAGTSEQVRLVLAAAEASAAEMRATAGREAGAHVARVEEATGGMLSKLDALEGQLGTLLESLRRSGEKLSEGLAELHAQVGDAAEPPEEDFAAAAPPAEPHTPAAAEPAPDATEPPAPARDTAEGSTAQPPAGDEAGARLTALNMALSGTPREETARYLAEHFSLADPERLLDDVYARANQ